MRNFQMNIKASGALAVGANIWYLRTLVHDKALIHIDTFSAEVGSTNS